MKQRRRRHPGTYLATLAIKVDPEAGVLALEDHERLLHGLLLGAARGLYRQGENRRWDRHAVQNCPVQWALTKQERHFRTTTWERQNHGAYQTL
jgi:hypothetical protein